MSYCNRKTATVSWIDVYSSMSVHSIFLYFSLSLSLPMCFSTLTHTHTPGQLFFKRARILTKVCECTRAQMCVICVWQTASCSDLACCVPRTLMLESHSAQQGEKQQRLEGRKMGRVMMLQQQKKQNKNRMHNLLLLLSFSLSLSFRVRLQACGKRADVCLFVLVRG